MAFNSNEMDLTLTIVFGCLATVLAFAGVIVAYVHYRSRYHALDETNSIPLTLEAALPSTQVIQNGRKQDDDAPGSASTSDDVESSSMPSVDDVA